MAAPQKKDPNKYAKNANIEADSLLKTLASVGGLILMLAGIAGIAMEMFKGGGILAQAWNWLWSDNSHLYVIPVVIAAFWLANRMMSSTNPNESKKAGNLPMYVMMAIGAFFVFRFITS